MPFQTAQAARTAAIDALAKAGVDRPLPGIDYVIEPAGEAGFLWHETPPEGNDNTAETEIEALQKSERVSIDADEGTPPAATDGGDLLSSLGLDETALGYIFADAARIAAGKVKVRKARTETVIRAFATANGEIPKLVAGSKANPSYQRHADAIWKAAMDGDRQTVADYPLKGKNTHALRLQRYRAAVLQAMDASRSA